MLISITSTPLGSGGCSYTRIGSAMELNNSSEGLGVSSHRGEGVAEHVLANAPYGKACLNCVRSKTRCAVLPSGPKCERYVPIISSSCLDIVIIPRHRTVLISIPRLLLLSSRLYFKFLSAA